MGQRPDNPIAWAGVVLRHADGTSYAAEIHLPVGFLEITTDEEVTHFGVQPSVRRHIRVELDGIAGRAERWDGAPQWTPTPPAEVDPSIKEIER